MVVVTSTPSSFHSIPCSSQKTHPFHTTTTTTTCNLSSTSTFVLRQLYHKPRKLHSAKAANTNGFFSIRSYMENSSTASGFLNSVIGSLPVVGLLMRILSDEGGVGSDLIDFAEFRRRVGNKCSLNESRAFYDFRDRHGGAGDPLYVLLCCWVAALGAGLLKTEEILEGAARLRISNDVEFEEQNFMAMMSEAKEKRAKLKVANPTVPMEARVEKALEAIYVCCFGKDPIEDEDEKLLCVILFAVFPSVKQSDIQRIVKDKKRKVEEGNDESSLLEPKPISKEAVEQQMKDLRFLRQNEIL